MSKADANKLGFTEDSKYVKICRDPDFYMGLDAWQRGSHYDKYLTEFGLPSNYLNDALLRVYFEYMVFRDWNNRKLVTNSEFNKIKDTHNNFLCLFV